ncbi:MAG: methionine aminotransferase [Bacteroidota bacterium]
MKIQSKLPAVGTTIFTVMSALANEHDAINLSQGFPNYHSDTNLLKLVSKAMERGHNQYAPMSGLPELKTEIANKIAFVYGKQVDPVSDVTVTAGATQALFTAIAAFVHPGDEVILIEPAYDSYRPSIEAFGGVPVTYELAAPDYQIDWEAFQKLITPKTRMIMINTPQNPSASTYSKSDMENLERVTNGTNIIVVSDEVYEHIIFDGEEHQSVFRFPDLYKRSLLVYSFGKTFHTTGWKIGYCVGPPELMEEFNKIHQFNVFAVNRPMQHALADYLKTPEHYLGLNEFFQKKRDFFTEALVQSRFKVIPSKGTYFQLADYSAISDEPDTEFAKRLTKDHGVAAIPVSVFYSSGRDEKVVRFCFAKTMDMLEQAGRLLSKV